MEKLSVFFSWQPPAFFPQKRRLSLFGETDKRVGAKRVGRLTERCSHVLHARRGRAISPSVLPSIRRSYLVLGELAVVTLIRRLALLCLALPYSPIYFTHPHFGFCQWLVTLIRCTGPPSYSPRLPVLQLHDLVKRTLKNICNIDISMGLLRFDSAKLQ